MSWWGLVQPTVPINAEAMATWCVNIMTKIDDIWPKNISQASD